MLKIILNAGDDTDVMQIIQQVLKANKVVVISGLLLLIGPFLPFQQCLAGAGISVAAGLPTFHGVEGLYNTKTSPHWNGYKGNMQDLFSVSSLQVFTYLLSLVSKKFILYHCRIKTPKKFMQKWLQILQKSPPLHPQLNFIIFSMISTKKKNSSDVTHKTLMGLRAKWALIWIPLSVPQTLVFLFMAASIFSTV